MHEQANVLARPGGTRVGRESARGDLVGVLCTVETPLAIRKAHKKKTRTEMRVFYLIFSFV